MKILVLGAEGMLGHKVVQALQGLDVVAPKRSEFDATIDDIDTFRLPSDAYVVNCIGAIPQKNKSSKDMTRLNVDLPHMLAKGPQRVIQIATDCVFTGSVGSYDEDSVKDSLDDYGLSKLKGEVVSSNMMHVRSSIVGPELKHKVSLFEWLRNQPQDAVITGYSNHLWNGVTTQAFAKVVRGVITQELFSSKVQHLVPSSIISKASLLELMAQRAGRKDIRIEHKDMPKSVDRTLTTVDQVTNRALWKAGGYQQIPTIEELIEEMDV